ncbi:hypothetical protein QFC19_000116 [Naganishia cerealis]|uniref:Uncharacterized protein n=1 Tax=Naganishia cerealis TaxID=610337 RepID=A0ACC2WSY5_9TREE|nr:hypothetical protein QFC19_000116 [Naganishia cerealis]
MANKYEKEIWYETLPTRGPNETAVPGEREKCIRLAFLDVASMIFPADKEGDGSLPPHRRVLYLFQMSTSRETFKNIWTPRWDRGDAADDEDIEEVQKVCQREAAAIQRSYQKANELWVEDGGILSKLSQLPLSLSEPGGEICDEYGGIEQMASTTIRHASRASSNYVHNSSMPSIGVTTTVIEGSTKADPAINELSRREL